MTAFRKSSAENNTIRPCDNGDGYTRTAHAAKPRTKWMKNGILGLRSKAGGRFAIKSASLERGQATFEHTELRFDRVH